MDAWRQALFDAVDLAFAVPWLLGDCPAGFGNNDISGARTAPKMRVDSALERHRLEGRPDSSHAAVKDRKPRKRSGYVAVAPPCGVRARTAAPGRTTTRT